MNNRLWIRATWQIVLATLLLQARPAVSETFSIVVIPDTQWYTETLPVIVSAQTQWVVDNRVAENIIYVAHLGDLKDDTTCDNDPLPVGIDPAGRTEWEVVDDAFALLENPVTTGLANGIPYGGAPGNHDFDQVGGGCPNYSTQRPLTGYNGILGPAQFTGRPYYGDSFVAGSNEYNYTLFSSGSVDFIAINLGYHENPSALPVGDPVLTWASGLLASNPGRLGIVTSHFFLEEHFSGGPTNLGNFGSNVYDTLSANPNLYMMLSAHRRGEGWRTRTRPGMEDVEILMSNYQDIQYPGAGAVDYGNLTSSEPGNSGLMRIMRFDTDTGIVDVETFAPPVPSLGRPMIVSDEFVANGNAMDRNTASNISMPFPVPELRPSAPILLDSSGSMAWSVDGTVGVPLDQRRMSYAKEAAKSFLDLMLAVPANEGQADFGIATFPDHPSSPCSAPGSEVVTALTVANAASVTAATGAGGTIDANTNLATENGTPMLDGLETAISMFSVDDQNRNVILMSDGYHNCPGTVTATDPVVDTLVADLNANNIRVFTVGFGEPGDVDNLLHRRLANDTTPTGASSQYFDVTADLGYDPALPGTWSSIAKPALDLAFKEILSSVMGLETAVDPVGIITGGESKSVPVAISEHDNKIGIYLSWQTFKTQRLDIALYDSSGARVNVEAAGVAVVHATTYSILTVDSRYLRTPGRVNANPWRLEISAGQIAPSQQESFQYSVMLDSDLKLHAKTGENDYAVGDTILLSAQIIENGQRVVGLSDIEVSISAPEDGKGNWLSLNQITTEQLASIPARKGSEVLAPFQRKTLFLNDIAQVPFPQQLQPQVVKLFDDGSHGDLRAKDGKYTNQFSNTSKEGVYAFYFRATGPTMTGNMFSREQLVQTYLPVRPSPATILVTAVELKPGDLRRVDIQVTPKDTFGNFIGPGNGGLIQLQSSTGQLLGVLRDNLDGSYVQTMELPPGTRDKDVDLSISVHDVVTQTDLAAALKSGSDSGKKHKGFWWLLLILLVGISLA